MIESHVSHRTRSPLLRTLSVIAIGASLISLGSGAAPALAQSSAAAEEKITFRIASGPLAQALGQFAEAGSVQFLYSSVLADGLRTDGLRGDFTRRDGIAQLLAGSGLTFRFVDSRTVAIDKAESGGARVLGPVRVEGTAPAGSRGRTARRGSSDSESPRQPPAPFTDANVDIPRTVDDVQPYYIFDTRTIDASGAGNIEDFLKERLTMNTLAQTQAQGTDFNVFLGNTSTINLRGLGSDKTLILVNGRRAPGIGIKNAERQPDLNGIPLSAISRIEVLPTSASGIYGGSAIGGVVNVVLKKDYSGGEVRAAYDNASHSDARNRALSASFGMPLEQGKTRLMLSMAWSDAEPLYLEDRREIYDRGFAIARQNSPSSIGDVAGQPPLGALPNIVAFPVGTPLTLDDGRTLGSNVTFIPAGTSSATSRSDLIAALLANAGQVNLDLPASTQNTARALLRPFTMTPETRSLNASLTRQFAESLDLSVEVAASENSAASIYNTTGLAVRVPADAPTNPFNSDVLVRTPNAIDLPYDSKSNSRRFTLGANIRLPREWTGLIDYTQSQSRFRYRYFPGTAGNLTADIASGAINPFVDTLLYPPDLAQYAYDTTAYGVSELKDAAVRGSGPLWFLPWSGATATFGIEHRIATLPESFEELRQGGIQRRKVFFPKEQTTSSGYLELQTPLLPADRFPMVYALELQAAGRKERYDVDTGTSNSVTVAATGELLEYEGAILNGQPIFTQASYASTNDTVGLKYQPVQSLTFRVSQASAFLPPSPSSLIRNPVFSTNPSQITDPRTGARYGVLTVSGDNAELKPQNSKSFNAGAIWEPAWDVLSGLRVNAEYYKVEQFDAFDSLSAQQLLDNESTYPDRVVRDASGTITSINVSTLNLYHRETEGWDYAVGYRRDTRLGEFDVQAAQSRILHIKNQYSATLPEYDSVDFPSENGAARYKTSVALMWNWRGWGAGWSTSAISSYKQRGAVGGPSASQRRATNPLAALETQYTQGQGGDTIPSQMYHDLYMAYAFDDVFGISRERPVFGLSGLTVQAGVKNVFNKLPPYDFYYPYWISPYGNTRLRSYWLNVKAAF